MGFLHVFLVPFTRTHKAMQDAWPGASVSAALFAEFVEERWLVPMRAREPLEQGLVLICDSGGGRWLHVSPELRIALERSNCRMFLPPLLEAWHYDYLPSAPCFFQNQPARPDRGKDRACGLEVGCRSTATIFLLGGATRYLAM